MWFRRKRRKATSVNNLYCVCGHLWFGHEHLHRGTYCSAVPCNCNKFRAANA